MKQVQRGFTLIELVMVIVILGVLAAVAVPKFVNLKGDAESAALAGVAGAISSASAINYAARSIGNGGTTTIGKTCAEAATAILQGGVPSGYTLSGTLVGVTAGTTVDCTLTGTGTTTAAITGI